MFADVSFIPPSGREFTPSATIEGLSEKTLKKEKGAALTTPSFDNVVTSAIGLGITKAHINLYRSCLDSVFGSTFNSVI